MRWTTGQYYMNRQTRLESLWCWHLWYAWYPVSVDTRDGITEWAWLESVQRKKVATSPGYMWIYREKSK